MKIAIDISPLNSGHKVRGVGFYIEYLKRSLEKYFPANDYVYFTQKNQIPSDTDLVHFPYFEPFFISLPIIKKYPTLVTVHDLTPIIYSHHFPAGIKGSIKWGVQRNLLKTVDGIITDSVNSQKDISRLLKIDKKKIHVAHLAAAEEFKPLKKGRWRDKIIEKYNLPEKFILYVGDATWNKNLPILVDAIKEINLSLVMVGKALINENIDSANQWNKDLLTVKSKIKGDKRFIQLGFIPTEDLVQIYCSAELLVFPSLYEGFGLPILEAMQSGCPVVLSNTPVSKEIAGDAAFYIKPNNRSDIASGIGEVFYTPNLQKKLSEAGLMQARKYSWKKTAESTIEAYKKVFFNA